MLSKSKIPKALGIVCYIGIIVNILVGAWAIGLEGASVWIVVAPILSSVWIVWITLPSLDKFIPEAQSNLPTTKKYLIAFKRIIAGTEFLYGKHRLHCIDCEGIIPWSAIIFRRRWEHTACPSCEAYTHFMNAADAVTDND